MYDLIDAATAATPYLCISTGWTPCKATIIRGQTESVVEGVWCSFCAIATVFMDDEDDRAHPVIATT